MSMLEMNDIMDRVQFGEAMDALHVEPVAAAEESYPSKNTAASEDEDEDDGFFVVSSDEPNDVANFQFLRLPSSPDSVVLSLGKNQAVVA